MVTEFRDETGRLVAEAKLTGVETGTTARGGGGMMRPTAAGAAG